MTVLLQYFAWALEALFAVCLLVCIFGFIDDMMATR